MKTSYAALSLALGALLLPGTVRSQAGHDMHGKSAQQDHHAASSGWKELDAFHTLMAATWHPVAKSNDLKPIRAQAGALSNAARAWAASKYPAACDTKTNRDAVTAVASGSRKIADMVAKKATDADVKNALRDLHTRFEVVEEGCKLPSPAESAEREAVLATLADFTQALRTKDTTGMLQLLDSAARMTLLRPVGETGATRVWVLSGPQFVRVATNPNNPALDEPIRNPVVHIDGPLASVWAEYQVRQNGVVTHCGFDAFQLVKTSDRWKILNVSDTYRRTGCGAAWPSAQGHH